MHLYSHFYFHEWDHNSSGLHNKITEVSKKNYYVSCCCDQAQGFMHSNFLLFFRNKAQAKRNAKKKTGTDKYRTQIQLNIEEPTVANQESRLYEEIGDMNTPTSTEDAGVSSRTGISVERHEYEDVKPFGSGVAQSSGPYHITECSAYGVPLN